MRAIQGCRRRVGEWEEHDAVGHGLGRRLGHHRDRGAQRDIGKARHDVLGFDRDPWGESGTHTHVDDLVGKFRPRRGVDDQWLVAQVDHWGWAAPVQGSGAQHRHIQRFEYHWATGDARLFGIVAAEADVEHLVAQIVDLVVFGDQLETDSYVAMLVQKSADQLRYAVEDR